MLARVVAPLVIALAVAFAPVALDACQVTCAAHAAAEQAGVSHHHAHGRPDTSGMAAQHSAHAEHACDHAAVVSPVTDAAHVTGVPHTCGHSDSLPPTSIASAKILLHAPAVIPVVVGQVVETQSPRTVTSASATPPPVPAISLPPLRV